ncbi:MAG: hypothetical protein EXX96DRAFT_273161 [Benjaminiella poitrasii]|nr:MAG: hypothetical protein EXX96DRAFT_273161 [Benjaminiella poitrasii]
MSTTTNKIRTCKICLETDDVSLLISPCHCKGSIKYVHPHCMAGWRKSLLRTGRENDIYHCQLCKHRLWVKQRRLWAAFLHYKVFRIIVTAFLLGLILIPAGSIMKAFIHFSALLSNYPGGLIQAWATNSFFSFLFSSSQTSILASLSSSSSKYLNHDFPATNIFHVLYSPFPVCFSSSSSSSHHALFSNRLLYYFLFPFSDERLWQLILCRLEHFHLGFFLLGSVNNIYFTYKILNDMFDIVLLGQEQQQQAEDRALLVDEIIRQHQQQQQQQDDNQVPPPHTAAAATTTTRLDSITRRLSKLLKGFLLTYCCSLVILFWIHFNIFAFHVDSKYEYTSKQFVAELPLWVLRWATLGIAVADFATRGIYRWLSRITNCVDEEVVMSLPENTIK